MSRHTAITRIFFALCCVLTGPLVSRGLAIPPAEAMKFSATPVWRDEFSGSSVDLSKWNVETGVRREAINTPNAVTVANGSLTITTYSVDTNGSTQHYTGFVDMKPSSLRPTYGYFESRINFHTVSGQWSSFWFMPDHFGAVGDPGTEIDVVENFGVSNNFAKSGVFWDGYGGGGHYEWDQNYIPWPQQDTFHTYGLAWDHDSNRFYLDNQLVWTFTSKVSDVPEYVCLTSEVQGDGTWYGVVPGGTFGDLAHSTTKTSFDYVRVYALAPEPSGFVLLGIGVMSVLAYVWQRRRQRHTFPRSDVSVVAAKEVGLETPNVALTLTLSRRERVQ
jgi:beta-glucanase (GH16 family)